MSLEHKLQTAAEPWLSEEILPAERAEALERLVRRRALRRWGRRFGAAAAAAAAVSAVLFWPAVVSVASGIPVIGPYIARMAKFDEGASWADQKGYVVPVGRSATDQGITFRVESVLADSARTVFYFVIEGEGISAEQGRLRFEDIRLNKMESRMSTSGRWEVDDGRIVGEYETGPLPTPTSVVDLQVTEVGAIKGDWHVSFMASRQALDKLSRTVAVGQQLKGDGYDLTVTRVLLALTQTVVEAKGRLSKETEIREPQLSVDGVAVKPHGISSDGAVDGTISFRFEFDRVDPDTASELVFSLGEKVRWVAGGPSVELKEGARTEYGRLWMEFLSIQTTADGNTEVAFRAPWTEATQDDLKDLQDWVVLDGAGREHLPRQVATSPNREGTAVHVITLDGKVENLVRAEARQHAERSRDGDVVKIPLK